MNKFQFSFLLISMLSGNVFAQTTSANFQANATLANSCSLSTIDMDFGVISSTQNQAQGTITSRCTRGTIYSFNISAGNSGNYADRSMKATTVGNNDVVLYNLYTDTSYASDKIWKSTGWGLGMGTLVNGTGNNQTFNIYGKIGTNQHLVTPDSYSDNLTLTLSF